MSKTPDHKTPAAQELARLRTRVRQLERQLDRLKGEEEATKQGEKRLYTVLMNMPVMIDAFDADWNVALWNRECERVTGYGAAEVMGNPKAMEWLYPDPTYREEMLSLHLLELGHSIPAIPRSISWSRPKLTLDLLTWPSKCQAILHPLP